MAILSDSRLTANGDGTWLPKASPQTLKTRFRGEISLPFFADTVLTLKLGSFLSNCILNSVN